MKKVVFILMFLLFPSYIFASPKIEDYVTTSFEEALIEEGIEKNFDTWVTNEKKVPIYVFRGHGCIHCKNLLSYLNSIVPNSGDYFDVITFEVWGHPENYDLMVEIGDFLGVESKGVPFTIIGDKVFRGYETSYDKDIFNKIIAEYNKISRYDVFDEMAKPSDDVIKSQINGVIALYSMSFLFGNPDVYDCIDVNNTKLKNNVIKYLGKTEVLYNYNDAVLTKIDDNTFKSKGRLSARGENWNISGIEVEFTIKNINGNFVITDTNMFEFIGIENIFNSLIDNFDFLLLFLMLFGGSLILILVIIIVVVRKKKKKKQETIIVNTDTESHYRPL